MNILNNRVLRTTAPIGELFDNVDAVGILYSFMICEMFSLETVDE